MHGESYTDFMMSKLVSVIGDVCKSNLGMDATSATEIAKAVDVIVNSAANTILDERSCPFCLHCCLYALYMKVVNDTVIKISDFCFIQT